MQTSLGIQLKTNLDEYQIEDKLNELFCLAIGINKEEFIRMQNDPDKTKFNELITKFNQYASFEIFKKSVDEIYKIQEEIWFSETGNLLDLEKEPTLEQTKRAMYLINQCKKELLKYAEKANFKVINKIKEEPFVAINEYGEVIRNNILSDGTILNPGNSFNEDIMGDETILMQAEYINYHQNILNQININNYLGTDASVIFITEFKYEYEKQNKIVYYRIGDMYKKIIIPILENGKIDIFNINISQVDDINEIKVAIQDCEAEFGVIANAPEYARILDLIGDKEKSKSVLNKWNYYLSKQGEIEQIKQEHDKQQIAFQSLFESIRNSSTDENISQQNYFGNLLNKTIEFENIIIDENGIMIIQPDGNVDYVTPEQEQEYVFQIQDAVSNGSLSLNRIQLNLLDSYANNNSKKR